MAEVARSVLAFSRSRSAAECITAAGQEIGTPQMVNLGGWPQSGRLVEKPQSLFRLVDRRRQYQDHLVAAFLDLVVFSLFQACGQRPDGPRLFRTRLGERPPTWPGPISGELPGRQEGRYR